MKAGRGGRGWLASPGRCRHGSGPGHGANGLRPGGRLRHRRGGFGGLDARPPPLGRSRRPGARARGGRHGYRLRELEDPHADGLRRAAPGRHLQLALQQRARTSSGRTGDSLPPRPGDRGLQLDQRHGLHPRARLRLRPLVPGGLQGLVLSRGAALFPPGPRPSSGARTTITAATVRSASAPASPDATPSTAPSSTRRARPAMPRPTT